MITTKYSNGEINSSTVLGSTILEDGLFLINENLNEADVLIETIIEKELVNKNKNKELSNLYYLSRTLQGIIENASKNAQELNREYVQVLKQEKEMESKVDDINNEFITALDKQHTLNQIKSHYGRIGNCFEDEDDK